MKKYIDWILWGFFIAGFLFGVLTHAYDLPNWLLIIAGAIVSIIGGVVKKKIE